MADGSQNGAAAFRALPSVQRLLQHNDASATLAHALRAQLAYLRAEIAAGRLASVPDDGAIVAAARAAEAPVLRRVINATGIVVHTNLGRAPLAEAAVEAALEAARGACNLEYDLRTGRRGHRGEGVEALLCRLTGAEAALAVNNNAAAMLLALTALAGPEAKLPCRAVPGFAGGVSDVSVRQGRAPDGSGSEARGSDVLGHDVIVSRGELVEIGGGFRIPDIIAGGGARLVEVGTTNKTRLADYEAAVTPRTRVLLKVHQSNFRMVGFTAEASLAELAGLARARGLLLLDDLGSGTLARLPGGLSPLEPTVRESLAAGTDLVAFSGDKLLGGPQAGLLAGRADVIARLRGHPLMRALRLDKMTLAALEATLRLHTDPARALAEIPVLRMLAQDVSELRARAEAVCALLDGLCTTEIVNSAGHAGGGALPGQEIASVAVSLTVPGRSPDGLAACLREQHPAVAGRISEGRFLLDMLTVPDAEVAHLAEAVRQGLRK